MGSAHVTSPVQGGSNLVLAREINCDRGKNKPSGNEISLVLMTEWQGSQADMVWCWLGWAGRCLLGKGSMVRSTTRPAGG